MAVTVGVAVGVTVAVGVGLVVAVAVAVGVGVPPLGNWIVTSVRVSFLKKPTTPAVAVCGGVCASNQKLYNVPQRIAFAF